MKKYKKSQPGFKPWTLATIVSILTLDHQSQILRVFTKLFPFEGTNLPNQ
jgi:hypothetical protein